MLSSVRPLSQSHLGSAIAGQSRLRPQAGARHRRTMVAGLMLTSLVDAFSILVIFLIMNHSANNEIVNLGDKIQLPQAQESGLIQQGITVRIEGEGQILVEDKPVAKSELINTLKSLNQTADIAKREGIIIVADRSMDYEALSPVILAGSQAGFTKFKFAVVRKN